MYNKKIDYQNDGWTECILYNNIKVSKYEKMGEQDWYFLYTHAQLTKMNWERKDNHREEANEKKNLALAVFLMIDTCLVVIIIIIFWFSKSFFFQHN